MKRGFTLVELLAVIVITPPALLITMPTILNIIQNVRDKAIINSIQNFNDTFEKALVKRELGEISFPEEVDDNCYKVEEINKIIFMKGTIPSSGTVCIDIKSHQVSRIDAIYEDKNLEYFGENGKIKLGNRVIGYINNKNKKITFFIDDYSYTTIEKTTWCEWTQSLNSNVTCLDSEYFKEGTKLNLKYDYICNTSNCDKENLVKYEEEIKEKKYYTISYEE